MNKEKTEKYLEKIDSVIENGKYKDDWASLGNYPVPEWYKNAKFGIFIHWGVYSVPAFGSEWYPRFMYLEGSKVYEHHKKTYGEPKDFGYADFVPMFKAEKFNPKEWVELFKEAGAKYVMPVAEHHDGFQMYNSDLSDWNAYKMGPKRDVLGELKKEVEDAGMVFSASSHRAENYFFFGGCRTFDSGLDKIEFQEPYGFAKPYYVGGNDNSHESLNTIYSTPSSKEHLEDWLVRTCEIVDKYQPKVVWFDWWIQTVSFKPYLKKFAAYYYNRALEWGHEVAINYKNDAYAYSTAVFDIERGQLSAIRPQFWQNDTSIAKNSWCFTENNDFKRPNDIICDLVDIVSKNGSLLLNVGPKSDGTITDEEKSVLKGIGNWLKVNGESIYDTSYWKIFGEGPTIVPEGTFTDDKRSPFTKEDVRFTYKAPYLYATVLSWDDSDSATIKSLGSLINPFNGDVKGIEVLGFDVTVDYTRDKEGMHLTLSSKIKTEYPVCFKIFID